MKLNGRVALITGAGQGIGKKIAGVFAHEGATVLINDVDREKAATVATDLNKAGLKAFPCPFNVAKPQEIREALAEVVPHSGPVDILVNNAGISPKKNGTRVPAVDMDYDEWTVVVDVNLNGVFNCCQAVLPEMIRRRQGKIVNISSASARIYTAFTGAHYIATKAGVIGLTHALAGELAESGINVNAIAPGRAWTEMAATVPKEVNDEILKTIPMRRFADTVDIANAALFLACEDSAYITGTTLDVNGGFYMN